MTAPCTHDSLEYFFWSNRKTLPTYVPPSVTLQNPLNLTVCSSLSLCTSLLARPVSLPFFSSFLLSGFYCRAHICWAGGVSLSADTGFPLMWTADFTGFTQSHSNRLDYQMSPCTWKTAQWYLEVFWLKEERMLNMFWPSWQ